MPLVPRPKRQKIGQPLSFRFSTEAVKKLKALAHFSDSKQVKVIETLIDDAFALAEKQNPAEIKRSLAATKP